MLLTPRVSRSERPSDTRLVLTGLAMGIPTYALGVSIHEGSHAVAGKMLGAKITDYSLIPGFHPRTGKFFFGYVSVRGLRTDGQRTWFLIAPKLTDSFFLGGYSLLYATDAIPSNHYGQLALLVLATGFWIDFSKDIVAFWDHNDTVKVYNMMGLDTELKRLPARLVHAGLSAAMGFAIYKGYGRLFEKNTSGSTQPLLLPVWQTSF